MELWTLKFTKRAIKDSFLLRDKNLSDKAQSLLDIIEINPYQFPPAFEKLMGTESTYSRRINDTHRLVYTIFKELRLIKVISMFRHYQ